MNTHDEFLPLPFRRRSAAKGANVYRIFKPDGQSIIAEGRTAAEAFKKSGVTRALHIVRESYENKVIISKDELPPEEISASPVPSVNIEAAATPMPAPDLRSTPATAPASAPAKPQALQDPPSKALSEDEVRKLLEDRKN
jgi:hypothetical protein